MDRLAHVCEEIARFNSRLKKVKALADYLRSLTDADLERAVSFLCCGPIKAADGKKFSVGGATIHRALLDASGWDSATLGACYTAVGDMGETAGLVMRGHSFEEPMSLEQAERYYAMLYEMRQAADRAELLREILVRARPQTLKFFLKIISRDLRIGLLSRQVEEAIAAATDAAPDEIRRAANRSGDLPRIALAARRGALHSVEARLFHPMDFMLAKPLDRLGDLPDPEQWWVEDKFDGIRSQAHFDDGQVKLFTRGMEESSRSFPEIVAAFAGLRGRGVVDGEILAWRGGRALQFNVLQQRIARKEVSASLMESIPVTFIAYDVLLAGEEMTVDLPFEQRRSLLEEMFSAAAPVLQLSQLLPAESIEDIDARFSAARERGNEGLVLKRRGSLYEAGKRGGAWLKVKRPYATLDVVVTAAEAGHGKRATMLSDYTFAVRAGNAFVNVGKAYSGLTDQEIRELTRIFRSLATERFGRVMLVRPQVVLEVAFDGVQKSARHKSGYALRFPRILNWRKDKGPEQSDTLERVAELYEASLR